MLFHINFQCCCYYNSFHNGFTETQILCMNFLIVVSVIHHYHNEDMATHFTLNGYMREDEKNNITARYTIHPEAVLDPLHKKRLLVPEGGSIL